PVAESPAWGRARVGQREQARLWRRARVPGLASVSRRVRAAESAPAWRWARAPESAPAWRWARAAAAEREAAFPAREPLGRQPSRDAIQPFFGAGPRGLWPGFPSPPVAAGPAPAQARTEPRGRTREP